MSDDILVTADGKRFFRGVELQPDDVVCRCGINKHPKNAKPFNLEEHAAKMAEQIRKEIDDEIIASLIKGEQTFDSFGRPKGLKG